MLDDLLPFSLRATGFALVVDDGRGDAAGYGEEDGPVAGWKSWAEILSEAQVFPDWIGRLEWLCGICVWLWDIGFWCSGLETSACLRIEWVRIDNLPLGRQAWSPPFVERLLFFERIVRIRSAVTEPDILRHVVIGRKGGWSTWGYIIHSLLPCGQKFG